MYTPLQSLYIRGSAGDPLPQVWQQLPPFRRGQLCLIAAGPGTGKSGLVLTYALRAKVPTLYFSADSDAFTQLSRSLSIMNGWMLDKSEQAVRSGDLGPAAGTFADIPIRFNYAASPSLDQIELGMMSYEEVYGDYPALVVVDNVTNVRTGSDGDDNPFAGLEALMDYLHGMARATSSCVIGLHHVTAANNSGDQPIPLSGIKGQIGRVPEVIWTLHRVSSTYGATSLNVSTVKNRGGRADPSGLTFASLEFIGESMTIRDFSTKE
jgi:RecA-family ATPase